MCEIHIFFFDIYPREYPINKKSVLSPKEWGTYLSLSMISDCYHFYYIFFIYFYFPDTPGQKLCPLLIVHCLDYFFKEIEQFKLFLDLY